MVVDEKGAPLSSVRPGGKVRLFGSSRTPMVTGRTADLTPQPLSAYDCLRSKLMQIQAREGEAWDGKCIRITAESSVIYDKIIQLMDVARTSGFPDISIARLTAR